MLPWPEEPIWRRRLAGDFTSAPMPIAVSERGKIDPASRL